MQYVIRSFDASLGQITVEYDNQWVYTIDLPIEDNQFPVGEQLEAVIQGMYPSWLVERQQKLAANPTNGEVIQAQVQPFPQPVAQEASSFMTPLNESAMESDIAFISEIVNEVLAAKGL